MINPILMGKAIDSMAHRGPNGRGVWIANNRRIGLGHRRLSINDEQGGTQPLFNRDKTLHATVNGELYGYTSLRTQLEAKGHQFLTRSDSELVIHLYAEYGLDFVQYLRGEFAFVLYDSLQQKMIAVRDRFGIKPLFYTHLSDDSLHLASEAKALFELGISPAWNEYALQHAFSLQYLPLNQSLFQQIHPIQPGHLMIYDGKELVSKPYWDLDFRNESDSRSLPELSEELDKRLRDAIECRMVVDNQKICCHLSGGIDSASIAAIASELHGTALPCFSVGFSHQDYNELDYAQEFARQINAPFHPVFIDAEDMINVLSNAVYYSEGLAINNHLSAKYILNREIKKAGFKIALSGEGADELFLGYLHFQQDWDPKTLIEGVASGIHVSNDCTLPLSEIEKQLGFIPHFTRAKGAIGYKLMQLLEQPIISSETLFKDMFESNALAKHLNNLHPLHQSTYLWVKLALSGYILRTLGDGCEMAHGVEGRVPFLDHHLFAFAKKIPIDLKIKNGVEKYIMRKTVANYVGTTMANKKKHPFIAPPFSLLNNPIGYEFLRDNLQSQNNLPFLSKSKVNSYIDEVIKKSQAEQISAEPVMMLMLTASLLSQRYGL